MQITDYLPEVEHAVNTVLGELHIEHEHLARLKKELAALTAATEDGYRRADFLSLNPDLDDDGLGTAIHWDTYFGADKDRHYTAKDVAAAETRISARSFSIAALSGNLLQYGKQGLSLQYGKDRDGCPIGREIAGVPLHEVIWQGRNQALHWEDGAFHAKTTALFEHLAAKVSPTFAEYKTRSVAYDVVTLLGWRKTEDFMCDMRLLA
jgi:hypothetical protein